MQGGGVEAVQLVVVLLLVFVIVFGALARRLETPYPIVLLIAGIALSLLPAIPRAIASVSLITRTRPSRRR